MSEIKITVPEGKLALIKDAVCDVYGYQEEIPDPSDPSATIPNPVTKAAFVKKQLKGFLRQTIRQYKRKQAVSAIIEEEL